MVKEAERFAEQDKEARDRVEAKNGLEQYAFALKQSITDESIKDKIGESDKKTIEDACDASLRWIESNSTATKAEFDAEKKKLEGICMPIMGKLAGDSGMGAGMPPFPGGGPPTGSPGGPTVEEFDVD